MDVTAVLHLSTDRLLVLVSDHADIEFRRACVEVLVDRYIRLMSGPENLVPPPQPPKEGDVTLHVETSERGYNRYSVMYFPEISCRRGPSRRADPGTVMLEGLDYIAYAYSRTRNIYVDTSLLDRSMYELRPDRTMVFKALEKLSKTSRNVIGHQELVLHSLRDSHHKHVFSMV